MGKPTTKKAAVATSSSGNQEPTGKERIEKELQLLQLRKKDLGSSTQSTRKIKKQSTKGSNKRQQKKIARALAVAEKEEARIEKAVAKAQVRKVRKAAWE